MSKDKSQIKALQSEYEKNQKLIEEYQQSTGHRKPMTRREFLGSGLTQFSATMFAPSILSILAKSNIAQAAECAQQSSTRLATFVNLNLSGGAALMANNVPLDIGGQPLPTYDQMGLGRTPNIQTAFANNSRWNDSGAGSGLLNGIREFASNAILANTVTCLIPSRSRDDNAGNKMSIAGLVTRAGLSGEKFANFGTRDSETGVRHLASFNINPPAPLIIRDIQDIIGAIGYVGALANMNANQQVRLVSLIKDLSEGQARKLASFSGGQNLMDLVGCSMNKNIENVRNGSDGIDPRNESSLASIWDFGNRADRAFGGMVSNALKGNAGAVSLELGGYDYHGNTRDNTDARDVNAGRVIGKTLASAAALNQKVFIHLTTDGAVRSDQSDSAGTNFRGDRGSAGSQIFLAFDPAGAPSARTSQLGGFTTGQAADQSTLSGGSVEATSAAVFANWAKFSGDTGLVSKTIPGVLSASDIDNLLIL